MTEKERVKRHIRFEKTDVVPWQINCTSELAERYMHQLGLEERSCPIRGKNVYRFTALDDFFGNHLAFLRNRAVDSVQEVRPGFFKDEWGVVWDRRIDRDIGNPVCKLLDAMNLSAIEVPDPLDPRRFEHFEPLIRAHADRYIIVKFSYSLFERAWAIRGMQNLMMDFIQNPSFVHDLFAVITEFNLKLLKHCENYPIDGVYFGDDWGGQRGLLMSPDTWRTYIKPYLKRMYSQAHSQGYDVFIHSCGNISMLLDDLVGIGLNVFNPFQPEVMDIERVMKKYSGRLAYYGSISIQHTLPFGTRDDVREEVSHRLTLTQKYRGLIPSPSHDMPSDVPLENTLAMLEILRAQEAVSRSA
jgi:uroporphyrinogen decarboxylase